MNNATAQRNATYRNSVAVALPHATQQKPMVCCGVALLVASTVSLNPTMTD